MLGSSEKKIILSEKKTKLLTFIFYGKVDFSVLNKNKLYVVIFKQELIS